MRRWRRCARGADAFIVAAASWQDPQLDELAGTDLPVMLVNRQTLARSLPYVGADDQLGIQPCVDHLAALGHRQIVHLAGPADTSTGRDRTTAFR